MSMDLKVLYSENQIQEKIKENHTQDSTDRAAGVASGKNGDQKNAQQVDGDDAGFRETAFQEGGAEEGRRRQNKSREQEVSGLRHELVGRNEAGLPVLRIQRGVRDDVDIHPRNDLRDPFGESGLAPEMLPLHAAPSQDDLCDTGKAGVFRDLVRDIIPVGDDDVRAGILRELHMGFQPLLVRAGPLRVVRRLDVKSCKDAAEGFRHFGGCPYDLRIGGRGGETGENVFLHVIPPFFLMRRGSAAASGIPPRSSRSCPG